MSRVHIQLPNDWLFEVEIPLRITDINYGHHMGNDAFLAVLHDARFRWLHQHGWTELDIDGVGLIMTEVSIRFKAEAGFGDTLRVKLAPTDIGSLGLSLVYLAEHAGTGAEVARAESGLVFFDYTKRKLAPMPDAFRAMLPAPGG